MVDHATDTAVEARLNEFLAAERRRAEDDYPHLQLRTPTSRRVGAPIRLAVLAAVVVAAVAMVRPWGWMLPATPGADPLGADGIPLSIGGQPVLRGADIEARLADATSFLAGGYVVLRPAPCAPSSPAPGAGCPDDWRLEESAGDPSVAVTTVPGGATFVRTSGAATVFRVRPVVDEVRGGLGSANRRAALLIEAVAWRQPTKGPIPQEATPPEGGDTNMALVPDFVSVWGGPAGETIVGYVPKDLLLNPQSTPGGTPQNPPQDIPMPVYAEDLTTLVGHMVAGHGFVPLGSSPAPGTVVGSPSAGPSADPWGPLAVISPQDGADQARNEGTMRITDTCVTLERLGEVTLLFWPADRTTWNGESRTITFKNFDGTVVTVEDGDEVVVGGSGDSVGESGLSGQEWVDRFDWVAAPAPSCPLDLRWGVGAVGRSGR
jgi:hypothetical protein